METEESQQPNEQEVSEQCDDKWRIDPSDDEEYEPSPKEIVRLFDILSKEGVLELEWQCPGRQAPSLAENHYLQEDEDDVEFQPDEEKSDFDFKDEMLPKFTPRKTDGGLKGSAKKKTTSLDGILSNMRRHRQLEELEKQTDQIALT